MQLSVRDAMSADLPFMRDMLYEAASIGWLLRDLPRPPADEVLSSPSNLHYLEGWGRTGDIGMIADAPDGTPIGAAWVRLFTPADRGNGIVAVPETPELAIGVHAEHRGVGAGGAMLAALLDRVRDAGYARVVLSVDPLNPARRLYERCGFVALPEGNPHAGTSVLMGVELGRE